MQGNGCKSEKITIKSEADTRAFGLRLAREATQGSVLAMIGELGTGKTTLTKYIAEGLGITEEITSPTFTIVQEYHSGRLPLYHFDLYRVHDLDELFEIGYEEYLYGTGLSVVEWADLAYEMIPKGAAVLKISYTEQEGERLYEFSRKEQE